MALTAVDFSSTFNYTVSPKLFKFEDLTDYAGAGVSASDYEGLIKIVAPNGVTIYNNTNWASPDIEPGTSVYNTTTIPLPLNGAGAVLQGSYTITYTVSNDNGTTTWTKSYTYDFSYESPEISISPSVNYNTPLLSASDETGYTVNSVSPTITRAWTLYYPAVLEIANITGTGSSISTTTFYTVSTGALQYSFALISTLTYDYGDNLYVSDQVSGTNYLDVSSDANLCQLYCGIKSTYTHWQTYKMTNNPLASQYEKAFLQVMSIATLLKAAYDCGKTTDASGYVAMIKAIGHFDDCSCDGSDPVLVTGLGGNGTVVVAAGTGISVDTDVSGSTTTYTVSLSDANTALLNSLYNTEISVGQGLRVTSATVGNTKTFTITSTIVEVQELVEYVTLDFSSGSVPTVTVGNSKVYGGILQAATVANGNNASSSDWQSSNNYFTVSAFFTGSAYNYYPTVHIMEATPTRTVGSGVESYGRPASIEVIEVGSTSFKIRFKDSSGNPMSGALVDSVFQQVKLLIKIVA